MKSIQAGRAAILTIEKTIDPLFTTVPTGPPKSYSVVPNSLTVDEGSSVTFTITTTNVPDGTTLYWTNSGTTVAADFSDNLNSGMVIINSGTGTVTRTLLLDATAYENETIILQVRTGSESGPIVATSPTVNVFDKTPAYAITAAASSVDEGSSISFTVTTANVPDGTTLYWTNSGTTNAADFTDDSNSGTVTINSSTGIITRSLLIDVVTSEIETIVLQLRTGSISGPIVATSGVVNVVDKTPTYSISASTDTVDEGAAVTFTITTTNVPNGTTLYWTNSGTTVAADFTDNVNSGTTTVVFGSASVVRTLLLDELTEDIETIILEVRTGSVSGPIVATSGTVGVVDKTATYAVAESASSVDEGASVIFTITTTNVPDGTTLYWTNSGTTTSADFTDNANSGTVTITSNTGTVTRTLTFDDALSETETIILQVRTGSESGTVVATSGVVNVVDKTGAYANFAVSLGSRTFGDINSVDVDTSGNVYVLIRFGGDAVNKTQINQYVTTADGIVTQSAWGLLAAQSINSVGLIKYSSAGVPLWVSTMTGTTDTLPLKVSVDPNGNLYVHFYASGSPATFRNYTSGGGAGGDITLTTAATVTGLNGIDVFLAKYDTSGVFQWCTTVRSAGVTSETALAGASLTIDSSGNSYTIFNTGNNAPSLTFQSFSSFPFGGAVVFTTFGTDSLAETQRSFLVKTDPNGIIQSVTRMTRQNPAAPSSTLVIRGIATNASGNNITVTFSGTLSGGFAVENFSASGTPIVYGTEQSLAAEYGGTEGYVAGFGISGDARWVSRINSTGNNLITPVVMDSDGNSYVGGSYSNAAIVASAGTISGGTITVSSYGTLSYQSGWNSYIVKYNPSGACLGATSITLSTNVATGAFNGLVCDASKNVYAAYNCPTAEVNSVSINNFVSAAGDGSAINVALYGNTESVKADDAILIKYNPSLAVQWVTRVETGSGSGSGVDVPRTVASHPMSNFVYFGGSFSNFSSAPLKIYNASGVSGNVIQYTLAATLSGQQTGTSNVRQGFLVKYA